MRPLSSLEFILISILAFVLGMGISYSSRHSNKQTKDKNKEDHTTYVFESENGVRHVRTHTRWIGDSIIIENDTTFIKRK